MQEEKPELLARNVNSWFADKDANYMVRSLEYGGNRRARALLSARYRRIANLDIATATLPLFAGNDQYEVVSSEVTDTRLYIKIVNHKLETAVVPGDYVQAGVVITNSEVTVTGIGYYTGTIEKTSVINKADQKIKVGGYVMTITAGGTTYISATSTSGYVSYSSSDDNVATVDNEGIVTGVGAGTAVITITAPSTENYNEAIAEREVKVSAAASGTDSDSGNTSVSESKSDTLLVRRGNWFYVNYTLKGGNADMSFTYGRDTDEVLIGDWDGDGIDTICVRRGNRFYFSNTLGGQSDFYIDFGRVSDEVVVGDWDGDGCDTICVRRGNHYYINNTLESGNAAIDFTFGRFEYEVLAGDWDGDGCDTLCIRRGNTFYINNTLEGGNAAINFTFGRTTDAVLSGDWDGDGYDTLCIRRGNHYYINNTLEGGNAAIDFTFGRDTDEVYAGMWI